jgi:AcrR family transcriptional regulator
VARYHHGDLRNALIDAAVTAARADGPDAVVLRDAARQVGVSHNAGYRHFASRDELLLAVAERGLGEMAAAMEAALAQLPAGAEPKEDARQRLWTVGRGYVDYARREPGMFRTMWTSLQTPEPDPAAPPGDGPDALGILSSVLDRLVEVGVLDPAHRPHSDVVAWSVVHGLAALLIDGPLRAMPEDEVEAAVQRLFDIFEHGLG